MPRYLFVYHGGSPPESKEAGMKAMKAWREWFSSMGSDVVDAGNPVRQSTTVKSDGTTVGNGGANPAAGYSVVEAKNFADAIAKAKGCPIRADGGSVELAEIHEP